MRVEKSKCGKVMYTSLREAREVVRKCKNKSSRSKIPKRDYYCKDCGGYHVTSQKNKSKYQ